MSGTRKGFMNYLIGLTRRRSTRKVHPEVAYEYRAAGAVFTDGTFLLAAYQPHKPVPVISGIGGKKEAGETVMYTAIRETLEELFEYKDVPKRLIEEIIESVQPKKVVKNGSYVFAVYNFKDLTKMLSIVKRHRLKSPLYKEFPDTLMKLIFSREVSPQAELSHLALLPLVPGLKIDTNLLEDIPQIKGVLDNSLTR